MIGSVLRWLPILLLLSLGAPFAELADAQQDGVLGDRLATPMLPTAEDRSVVVTHAGSSASSVPPLREPVPHSLVAAAPALARDGSIALVAFGDTESTTTATTTDASLDEATKKEALERLKSASEWLRAVEEAAEKPQKFQAEIDSAPNDLREVKQALALPRSEPQFHVGDATPLVDIEQATAAAETKLKQAKDVLVNREQGLKRRGDRQAELAKLVSETEKNLEETLLKVINQTISKNESKSCNKKESLGPYSGFGWFLAEAYSHRSNVS